MGKKCRLCGHARVDNTDGIHYVRADLTLKELPQASSFHGEQFARRDTV